MTEKIRYKCISCGYKFSRSKDSTASKICPMCSKTTIALDKSNEATAILKEATSKNFDF